MDNQNNQTEDINTTNETVQNVQSEPNNFNTESQNLGINNVNQEMPPQVEQGTSTNVESPVIQTPNENVQEIPSINDNKKRNSIIILSIVALLVIGTIMFIIMFLKNDDEEINNNKGNTTTTSTTASTSDKETLAKELAVDWIDTYIDFQEYCNKLADEGNKDNALSLAEKWLEENVKTRLDSTSMYLDGKTYGKLVGYSNDTKLEISQYYQFMISLYSWDKRYTIDDITDVEITHQDTTDNDIAIVTFKNNSHIPPVTVNVDQKKINATSLKKDTLNLGSNRIVLIKEKDATIKFNGVDIKKYNSVWSFDDVKSEYTHTISDEETIELSIDINKYDNDKYEYICVPLVYIPFVYEYEYNGIKKTISLEDFEKVGNIVVSTTKWKSGTTYDTELNLLIMTEEYMNK